MVCYYRIAALPYCRIAVLPYYHTIEHLTCLLAVIRKTLLASKKAMMCKPRTLLATRRAQEDREGQSAFRHCTGTGTESNGPKSRGPSSSSSVKGAADRAWAIYENSHWRVLGRNPWPTALSDLARAAASLNSRLSGARLVARLARHCH